MDILLYAITGSGGSESVVPYNNVSFRLLQRMADVLMNYNVDEPNDLIDPFQPGIDVLEHLKQHYYEKFVARKKREKTFWLDPDPALLAILRRSQQGGNTSGAKGSESSSIFNSFL